MMATRGPEAIRSLRARSSLAEFVMLHLSSVAFIGIMLWFGSSNLEARIGIIASCIGALTGSILSLGIDRKRRCKLHAAWGWLLSLLLGGGAIVVLHIFLNLTWWATAALVIGIILVSLLEFGTRPSEQQRQTRVQRFRKAVSRELS